MMRRVAHIGPHGSKGGMSSVIENMIGAPPEGWQPEIISTHGETLFSKIWNLMKSRSEFMMKIKNGEIDLAHIHVTHSFSWWRKIVFLRICERYDIPAIIHIHSGKFDDFCNGFPGKSVKINLSKPNRRTVILEERWKKRLQKWIPENSIVVHNSSPALTDRRHHKLRGPIKLLMMTRDSSIKGTDFAVRVADELGRQGVETELTITGSKSVMNEEVIRGKIKKIGWVNDEEKAKLIQKSDFLLSPSKFEGSSMSIIESMVSGLPCIVSSPSAETVGIEMLTVTDFDPQSWSKRVMHLIQPHIYHSLGPEILESAKRFDVNRNKKSTGLVYEELISKRQ